MKLSTAATTNAVPSKWDAPQIPAQHGRRVIVTGANSGIGYVTALELARHGADVTLACRSQVKGSAAIASIQQELALTPNAGSVEYRELDLGSLTSVKAFAETFTTEVGRLDLLINNAGIMGGPYRLSVDGYEAQFATNHLGHFALTARLFSLLKQSNHARVVTLSSKIHQDAKVDLDAIVTPEATYDDMAVYANTKVYNLLFTFELNRRLQAHDISNVLAVAAHPGFSSTNLIQNMSWLMQLVVKIVWLFPIVQSAQFGALPALYAAVGDKIQPSDYIGPDGYGAFTGYPTKEEPQNVSASEQHARVLWEQSEQLAAVAFEF